MEVDETTMKTIFKIIPDKTAIVKDSLNTGAQVVTQTGGKYNSAGYIEFGVPVAPATQNGIYVPYTGDFKDGLTLEFNIMFNVAPPDNAKGFCVKAGTIALGVNSNKPKIEWTADSKADQAFSDTQLPVGKWINLKFGYDSLGKFFFSQNGVEGLNRIRLKKGDLPFDPTQKFQLITGLQNCKVKSIIAYTGKPTIATYSMESFCYNRKNTEVEFVFKCVDASLYGAELSIVKNAPYGSAENVTIPITTIPTKPEFSFKIPMPAGPNDIPGNYWFRSAVTKSNKQLWKNEHNIYKQATLTTGFPGFVRGLYNVRKEDFALVKSMGCTHVFSDWIINATPGGWQKYPDYLAAADAAGLKMIVAGNLYVKQGTIDWAEASPAMGGYYAGDEIAGNMRRIKQSGIGMKCKFPKHKIIGNMNNFSGQLDHVAEGCDILMPNTYMTSNLQAQIDATEYCVSIMETWGCIPQYNNVQPSAALLYCMGWLSVALGATGLWIFEWEHDTYQTSSEDRASIQALFQSLAAIESDLMGAFVPLLSDNPLVKAANRGSKMVVVNSSPLPQAANVGLYHGTLDPYQVWVA